MQPDLLLYTDGSGREQDGFGGYAAVIKTPDGYVNQFVMGAISNSTVDRAEFTALIEGLRVAYDVWKALPDAWLSRWPQEQVLKTPHIMWYSDRESLVLSAKNVNSRNNCPDLWAAYEYFESRCKIEANFIDDAAKELSEAFSECDLQASSGRLLMKGYFEATPLQVKNYEPKKKKSKKDAKQDVERGADSKVQTN